MRLISSIGHGTQFSDPPYIVLHFPKEQNGKTATASHSDEGTETGGNFEITEGSKGMGESGW